MQTDGAAERVAALERELGACHRALEELRVELAELRCQVAGTWAVPATPPANHPREAASAGAVGVQTVRPDPAGSHPTTDPVVEGVDRRELLGRVGAAGATLLAGGAVLAAAASPAGAANRDPLVLGVANSASLGTTLTSSGLGLSVSSTAVSSAYALQATRTDALNTNTAINATNAGLGPAIRASASSNSATSNYAVEAWHNGPGGALHATRFGTGGTGHPAVVVEDHGTAGGIEVSSEGIGLSAAGTMAPLRLVPQTPARPTSGTHEVGEIRVGTDGTVMVCTGAGTPGQWRELTAGHYSVGFPGGMVLMPAPFRLFDSRPGQPAPIGGDGKLPASTSAILQVTGTVPSGGGVAVPSGSVGVLCTITVTETEGSGGNLKAFPGTTPPNTSVLNWFGPGQNLATTTIVRLSSGGQMTLRAGTNATHAIVDVVGFLA